MTEKSEPRIDFKRLRQAAGLTQVQVADRIGVKQHTVSGWDRGGWPHAKYLPALADLFSCSIDELYGLPRR
jgi:transcriptional regulator with XRE-family HTH domain